MAPSEIEERSEDDQSSDTAEQGNSLESNATEEEDGALECALEALMKKRKIDLVEGERALKRAMLRFDKEKNEVYATSSDVLHLNVGGTNMTVLRSTLTSVPGSTLALKFSGHGDDSIERDRDGNHFIDHLFPAFELMVNHLRAKACQSPNAPILRPPAFSEEPARSPQYRRFGTGPTALPANPAAVTKLDFHRMLEYYGMVLGIYAVKFTLLFGNPSNVEYKDDLSVNASNWATFGIEAKGHGLTIRTFEVTIFEVERAQIGWRQPNRKPYPNNHIDSMNGVGDVDGTVALDFCRSVMLVNGIALPIHGTCKEGSTIRCEERGKKWYVDGRLVASTDQADDVTFIDVNMANWDALPAISAKGSFSLSDVEYYLY
jgi:hypothetical protein